MELVGRFQKAGVGHAIIALPSTRNIHYNPLCLCEREWEGGRRFLFLKVVMTMDRISRITWLCALVSDAAVELKVIRPDYLLPHFWQ